MTAWIQAAAVIGAALVGAAAGMYGTAQIRKQSALSEYMQTLQASESKLREDYLALQADYDRYRKEHP